VKDWDAVAAFALTLPDAELGTSYGAPAVKLNGKSFVTRSREADSFHVMSPHDEKAILLETDSDTFWQTPHYANWPGLLVRYASPDPDRVRRVITRAWWDRAKSAQRGAFGERP
jgi:hypothetical protein